MRIRRIFAFATALVLSAAISVPSATAQSLVLKSQIPFEFRVDGKVFPAGTYTVSQLNPEVLRLKDARGRATYIMTGRETAGPKNESWLVFHRYGDVNFFAGAYVSGSPVSFKVPASRSEQDVAKNKGRQDSITIAAR